MIVNKVIVNKVIVKPSRSYLGVGGEGVEEKKNTKNKGILHCKVLRQKELHIFIEQRSFLEF